MTLNELADELLEIRRYVRTNPEYVRSKLLQPVNNVHRVKTRFEARYKQILENCRVGLDRIHCDPEILEGYLYGAAAEIRELALKEDKS